MIKALFQNWQYQQAGLLTANTRGDDYPPVDVTAAAERAVDLLGMEASETNGYVIPLFAKNEPLPTSEYVLYRPQTGDIGWFDSGFGVSGTQRFTDASRLDTTSIGHRLRFWLPEFEPSAVDLEDIQLPPSEISPKDRLTDNQREAFFRDLRDFVKFEQKQQRETNWEEYTDLGIEEARRRNKVTSPFVQLSRLQMSDDGVAYRFQLLTEDDDHSKVNIRGDESLFSGNYCILDTDTADSNFPIPVEILVVDDPTVVVRPEWERISNRTAVEAVLDSSDLEIHFHELLNPVPYERQLKAISQVKQNPQKSQVLAGQRPVRFTTSEYLPDSSIELNDSQRQALVWAAGAEDVICIHGPPGTGKTRTLTTYIKQAVARGKSVLVTAHSNQAVDNLLVGESTLDRIEEETLHATAQDPVQELTIARIGTNTNNHVVSQHYTDVAERSADVVAATTSGAAQFDPDTFDVAVVDEATQASRPATTIVLNCAKKLVLAGDHKQLPPYCADEHMQEEDMHISLFEYLLNRYDSEISVFLDTQYRMNSEIAAYPDKAFYGGNLKTAEQNKDWTIDDLKPLMGVHVEGDERRDSYGQSYYNDAEADAVAKQVKLLVMSGVDPGDIGVISAYSGQVGKIINSVKQLDIDSPHHVSINTVDSFQGGEREAVIVSFVRSNADGYSGFLEFPEEGPRRLNVALTRARKRLVLIGNWETLGTRAPHRSAEDSCAHYYRDLAEHIRSTDRMLSATTTTD